jgi:hypothetical protein
MAEHDQVTGAAAGLAGPGLPAGCDQIPALARRVGQSLVDAGFSLHRCSPRDPLGGVCLTPLPGSGGEDPAGICVSWPTHDRLLFDEGRWAAHSVIMHVMNTALGTVLRSLGWDALPFGDGGAWIIPLRGAHGTGGAAS